jgi:hypothetical protein
MEREHYEITRWAAAQANRKTMLNSIWITQLPYIQARMGQYVDSISMDTTSYFGTEVCFSNLLSLTW